MRAVIAKFIRNNRGATAVEYGLILALCVISVMAGVKALGGNTSGLWGNMTAKVVAAEPN